MNKHSKVLEKNDMQRLNKNLIPSLIKKIHLAIYRIEVMKNQVIDVKKKLLAKITQAAKSQS